MPILVFVSINKKNTAKNWHLLSDVTSSTDYCVQIRMRISSSSTKVLTKMFKF